MQPTKTTKPVKLVPLKDLCESIIDCPHSTPVWKKSGIPVVRNYNLKNGLIDLSNCSFVDQETYDLRTKRAVPHPGDIILSREAPIGSAGLVPDGLKCCLGQRLVLLRVDKTKCSPEYLIAALTSDIVQQQFKRVDTTGSIVSNFNIGDLGDLLIPFIESEQRVIGSFWNETMSAIARNNRYIELLHEYLLLIYQYWFLQFDFPDENGKPYRQFGGKMVWNDELGREIPEGWRISSIGKALLVKGRIGWKGLKKSEYLASSEYRIINGDSLTKDGIDWNIAGYISKERYDESPEIMLKEGDILLSKDGTIGKIGYVDSLKQKSTVAAGIFVLRDEKNLNGLIPYILQILNSKLFKGFIEQQKAGSVIPHLYQRDLNEFLFPMPPANTLDKFSDIASPIFKMVVELQKENLVLKELQNILLPLLMNGQVTIKDPSEPQNTIEGDS